MTTAAIRATIEMAKQHEREHGHLAALFEHDIMGRVHLSIQLPEHKPVPALVNFVIAYIEHVPDFLDAAHAITQAANIAEHAQPFLKLAQDYFLKPPEIIAGHIGLDELMDEAYLAHRLIEEVNDRYMVRTSIPLVPVDMTMSNLIVHSLIGEPFANELDEAVLYTVERTLRKQHVYDSPEFMAYVARHKNNHWEKEQRQWPCLTDQLSINLQFSQRQ